MPRGISDNLKLLLGELFASTAEWHDQANCLGLDTELFFPEIGHSRDTIAIKEICTNCVVRQECLNYALNAGEKFGIWGGYSEKDRRRMRGARMREAK